MRSAFYIGISLLLIGNVFSALYDVSIKWVPEEASATSFLLLRQVTAVLMILPFWYCSGRPKSQLHKFHCYRANIGAVGALALISGLMVLPLATVSSLFYTGPIIILLLGYFYLKESVTQAQWLTVLLGFVGIVIMLRPSEISMASLLVLFSATTFAICQLTLRKIPATEHVSSTLMLNNLYGIPLIGAMVLIQGACPFSWQLLAVALASNAFLLIYHGLCVMAYRQAKASEIAIAEYSGLIFVVLLGWLLFDEWLDNLTWFGAALIVLPTLLLQVLTRRPPEPHIEAVKIDPLQVEAVKD
ncbi:DMT family transporter [Shewanella marina]|uniref:DMT family transporter n=1 Tax=Shewanella marina TaxID=487319 RepID=UPI00046ED13F|nr:DMT family transporter [Shewanella marina]